MSEPSPVIRSDPANPYGTRPAAAGGAPSDRTAVRRLAKRGVYDAPTIHHIIDEALVCHVGFVDGGQPFVIPTLHARIDDRLYLHGSQASRMLAVIAEGAPACITITLIDGLVLARSAFHHSVNYRSVVVLGTGREVTDPGEKQRVFERLVEHVAPGRWADCRWPNDKEMNATRLVSFPLDESSAKVRVGPPVDDEEDYDLPHWAGLLPLILQPGIPIADPRLKSGITTPVYLRPYRRPGAESSPQTG